MLTGSGAIREHGLADQSARLEVTTLDGHQIGIDMGVAWRTAEPAVLGIGPVLSLEDAVT